MATTIKSADLDFNTIKTRLKDYLKSKTEFQICQNQILTNTFTSLLENDWS